MGWAIRPRGVGCLLVGDVGGCVWSGQLRSTLDSLIAFALATSVLATPVLGRAAGPAESDPVREQISAEFGRGQDRYETSDFEGAIEAWQRAYELLPDGSQFAATRALLLANLARAHVRAHAIDDDIEHLRRAEVLYGQYLAALDPADDQTLATIEAERTEVVEAIAAHDEAVRKDSEVELDERRRIAAEEELRLQRDLQRQERRDARRRARGLEPVAPYSRAERALLVGGTASLSLSLATTGAMAAFLWLRDEQEREGARAAATPGTSGADLRSQGRAARRFNSLAISTGATAAVFGATGLALLTTALVRYRRRLPKTTAMPVPIQRGIALSIGGRF